MKAQYVLGLWLEKTTQQVKVLKIAKTRFDSATRIQKGLRHQLLTRLGPDDTKFGAVLGEHREVRRLRVRWQFMHACVHRIIE